MKRLNATAVMAALTVLVIGASVLGYLVERRQYRGYMAEVSAASRARAEVEQRIIGVVVARNPDASIRDFADFPAHLLRVADEVKIDFRLAMALIDAESEWRPRAVGAKGEIGLLQVRPQTAALVAKRLEGLDYKPPVSAKHGYSDLGSLGDPKVNVLLGLTFLAWQRDSFGPGAEMLRAYNRGPSRARERWAGDLYAERVGVRLVSLVQEFR